MREASPRSLIRTRAEYDATPSADYEALRGGSLVRERRGLAPMGAGFDWHLRFEQQHLRFGELAQDVDRNDLVIGQGVSRFCDNVLMGGPTVDPNTGNDEANELLQEGWLEWGQDPRRCHALGTMNWSQIRRTTLRAAVVAGDIFQVMQNDNTVNLMEWHRCRTPKNTTRNVVFGILKDDLGRHLECWFTKEPLQPAKQLNNVSDTRATPIYDSDGFQQVMHVMDRQRPTQTRGLTKFAPMFKAATIFDDIVFAQLVKEQIQSCFVVGREMGIDAPPGTLPGTAGHTSLDDDGPSRKLLENIYPGVEVTTKPGEVLKFFTPQVAGADFVNFSQLVMSFLAINLDTPLAVFLLDATKGNFSSMRGVIQQARLAWSRWQRMQVDQQERPTYLWQVRAMVESNTPRGARLRKLLKSEAIRNIYGHEFHYPEMEYIQPLQDVTADALEVASGLNSSRRVANRRQVTWHTMSTEIVEDDGILAEKAYLKAKALNDKYPDADPPFSRLEFGRKQLPNGMQLNLTPVPEAEPKKEPVNDD